MGGIVEVYIANYDDVSEKTLTDDIIKTITMSKTSEPAPKFKKYTFPKGTGSMTSTLNVDAANGVNYVSTELALSSRRWKPPSAWKLRPLRSANWLSLSRMPMASIGIWAMMSL